MTLATESVETLIEKVVRGNRAKEHALKIKEQAGSLSTLLRMTPEEISKTAPGMRGSFAEALACGIELGRRAVMEDRQNIAKINCPEDAALLVKEDALRLDREQLWVISLDVRNQVIGAPYVVSTGTVNGTLVHPREVFRRPVSLSASSIILAHNHPSGDITPSMEDLRSTREMVAAGRTLGLRVHDHVIIGRPATAGAPWFASLRQMGLVTFEE